MFLDDKLYQHTTSKEITVSLHFESLMNELYKITEDHFKPKLNAGMSYVQGRVMMDTVFNGWKLFINRLDKDKHPFAKLIKEASYEVQFMNNPELAKIYNKGK